MFSQSLSLVVPCYNEQARLNLKKIEPVLFESKNYHFCFVDDGSQDGTLEILREFQIKFPSRITVLHQSTNKGKGEAVRHGILHTLKHTDSKIIGYWDADMATPLDQLEEFMLESTRHTDWLALIGCRHRRLGVSINRSCARHYIGRVFASIVSPLLNLRVYDTQCGAKLFRAKLAEKIFSDSFCSRWCFDVEVLVRIIELYGAEEASRKIVEVPLRKWVDVPNSKITLWDSFSIIQELFNIKTQYNLPIKK